MQEEQVAQQTKRRKKRVKKTASGDLMKSEPSTSDHTENSSETSKSLYPPIGEAHAQTKSPKNRKKKNKSKNTEKQDLPTPLNIKETSGLSLAQKIFLEESESAKKKFEAEFDEFRCAMQKQFQEMLSRHRAVLMAMDKKCIEEVPSKNGIHEIKLYKTVEVELSPENEQEIKTEITKEPSKASQKSGKKEKPKKSPKKAEKELEKGVDKDNSPQTPERFQTPVKKDEFHDIPVEKFKEPMKSETKKASSKKSKKEVDSKKSSKEVLKVEVKDKVEIVEQKVEKKVATNVPQKKNIVKVTTVTGKGGETDQINELDTFKDPRDVLISTMMKHLSIQST